MPVTFKISPCCGEGKAPSFSRWLNSTWSSTGKTYSKGSFLNEANGNGLISMISNYNGNTASVGIGQNRTRQDDSGGGRMTQAKHRTARFQNSKKVGDKLSNPNS